ncbi:phosphate transporter [Deinococcus proteolyticus MRP]|uniref:Phosphate transporter n=1 Tax=Deinococcus proteolyticus (strain ATCC 35074 / DSM 20540 / JCM 6276 / NBRC 101906 / NCIMB 13154 / VKM Ac-1939 / CCM 2703 / MRP) TaxID=693977 RepID=F0RNW8_DEIPM|nr:MULTISPECIES: inorganic phosphate transporter [Deinococcus]ADY26377.1 phosphate transporter [Deinococcus proteolyticus MRP]MCY1702496.1 inorganic phosphate transporter [Deinococcus sp. SL84]
MEPALLGLIAIVTLALIFDFINGFHDTANAIATSVATRVLTPQQAIAMAAVLNVVGALTGTAVAKTISSDIVPQEYATLELVGAALVSAIIWNLFTWWKGLPSSSSHALIFSLVGAGVAAGGWDIIIPKGVIKTLQGLFYSPILGFVTPIILMALVSWLFLRWMKPAAVTRNFRVLQILSAAFMAYSHGRNDAQKTMGIITFALSAYFGTQYDHVPLWVILSAATAMGLGTAMGGWRIIKTMGFKVVDLKPVDGFVAETSAALIIDGASTLGIPVSTTHTISSSIMGVGTTKGFKKVKWQVAGKIVQAWIFTIPTCLALGWAMYRLVGLLS